MMVLRGRWDEAAAEAERASAPGSAQTLGPARYQRAEIHRLRGELAQAEDAYRSVSDAGRSPQPGLALLRLAQGRVKAALSAIDRATDEARERKFRAGLLAARIEIHLAAGDPAGARRDADELSAIATDLSTPFTIAIARRVQGAVVEKVTPGLRCDGSRHRGMRGGSSTRRMRPRGRTSSWAAPAGRSAT